MFACSSSRERLEALVADIRAAEPPLDGLRQPPQEAAFLRSYAASRDLPTHQKQLADPAPTFGDPELFNRFAEYHRSLFRDDIFRSRSGKLPTAAAPGAHHHRAAPGQ